MFGQVLLKGLLALLVLTTGSVKCENAEIVTADMLDLLNGEDYDDELMPFNGTDPLWVKISMYLRNVEVNDDEMTTSVDFTFRMMWTDERLAYEDESVDFVNIVDAHKLWLPDAFFKNSIETTQMKSVYPETYARVNSDGEVIYSTRLQLELRCPMDLSSFPHDTQNCPLQIGSYGYTNQSIKFYMDESEDIQITDNVMYRSRFSFDGYDATTYESGTSTGYYSNVEVSMELSRVASTYSVELFIPAIFLVVVAFFCEVIPAEALLPRLLLVVVPLVTLASYTFFYSLSMPAVPYAKASDIFNSICLLSIFFILIHNLIAYYRRLIEIAEKKRSDAEGKEFTQSGFGKMMFFLDKMVLFFTVVFFVAFVIIYFIVYAC